MTDDEPDVFAIVRAEIAAVNAENATRGAVMAEHETLITALWTG
jgi:hypothetical protein